MSEPKTHCINCGRRILQRTADRKNGLCAPCHAEAMRIPPEGFRLSSRLHSRLAVIGEEPQPFRQMEWERGTEFVDQYIDRIEQRIERVERWLPRLREFEAECRRAMPCPPEKWLTDEDREVRRICGEKFSDQTVKSSTDSVAICSMPLVAIPVAQELWSFGDESPILLTSEESLRWGQIYSHQKGALTWIRKYWWTVEPAPSQRFVTLHWSEFDMPGGEWPWHVSIGFIGGPLFGYGHSELWIWNGKSARYAAPVGSWIS